MEGDDRVNGQLSGGVNQTASTPLDPTHGQLARADSARVELHVGRRAAAPDRDQLRVLTQQEVDLTILTADHLVDQPLLEGLTAVEVEPTAEVGLYGGAADQEVEGIYHHLELEFGRSAGYKNKRSRIMTDTPDEGKSIARRHGHGQDEEERRPARQ